ncbi:MAG TPA: hypothetical protein VGM77_07755 [Gemmatimonadales bacterium]|jgi:hypothetical protein
MIVLLLALNMTLQDPTPMHYHIEAKTVSKVDVSAMGQGVVTQTVSTTAQITVTMHDTAGGRLADIVVDTATFDAPNASSSGVPPEMIANPTGTTFHIYVVDGKVKGSAVPSTKTLGSAQIAAAMGLMFPGAKPTAKAGESWVDSVTADSSQGTSGQSVVHWSSAAGSDGELALNGASSGSATVNAAGAPMQMTATGKEEISTVPGGPSHRGNVQLNAHGTMTMSGASIPIDVTTTTTLARIP